MPRHVSELVSDEQPINWSRAIFAGILASWLMMAVIDIFAMMGVTHFCLEYYLGTLIRGTSEYGPRDWLVGFIASSAVGAIGGILYGFCFEDVFARSGTRLGTALGLAHAFIAAFALFPFFNAVREQMEVPVYARFGFFGEGLDPATPILLLFSHLAFGALMGLFYGPVRAERVRARDFEPGESGLPYEEDVIHADEDPRDRSSYGYQ